MTKLTLATGAFALLFGSSILASMTSGDVEMYYSNPNRGTENLSSFDWDNSGSLYWMGGDANWAESMNVYKYDGTLSTIASRPSYAGSWVCSHNNSIYFDDGSEYTLYKYDTVNGGAPVSAFQQNNAWGYTFHNNGLYISGADANWNNSLYYSALDAEGNLTGSIVNLGFMGSPSGPITFDANDNLFYAGGYSSGLIYKYSSEEITAAIGGTALSDASAHEYIDFNSYGLTGSTGMDFDSEGNLVVSLTSFGSPSKLVAFDIDESGNYAGSSAELAVSDGRMTTVRNNNGDIYVGDPDGIYKVVPEPASALLLLIGALGITVFRRYKTHIGA